MIKLNDDLEPKNRQLQTPANDLEQQVRQLTAQLSESDQRLNHSNQQLLIANQKLEDSGADLLMLEELGRYLTSSLALDQVIENVYQSLNVLDVEVILLGILDNDNQAIQVPLIVKDHQKLPPATISLDDVSSPAVWCVNHKKELLILKAEDINQYFSTKLAAQMRGKQMQTIVYVPLIIGDEIVGCLSIQNPEENAYSNEQIDLFRTLASYSAIAITNALGYTKLAQTHESLKHTQQQLVLQEKMASLGTLTAGVAHEINNPINFAHIGAENLSVDLLAFETALIQLAGDDVDSDVLDFFDKQFMPLFEHLSVIKSGTRRIKNIVQDLRTFTHFDHGELYKTDVVECVESTLNLIKTRYVGITEFVTDFHAMPALECYPAQLNQVFTNIIANACDAIKEKHKEQTTPALGLVELIARRHGQLLTIVVKDNGCGMSDESKSKVFEPFYTTKVVGQGTGLGMAIAFGIVEDHGGNIEVETTLGKGTAVTICLPLQPGA
jgi:signal transduction histidine kinase